jgi:hypothetical protein
LLRLPLLIEQYFTQKNINSKSATYVSIMGIMFTPWGAWVQAVTASGGHRNCAKGFKNCRFAAILLGVCYANSMLG